MRAPGGPRNTDNDEGAGRSRDSWDHSNTCAKWRIGQTGEYQNNMGMDSRRSACNVPYQPTNTNWLRVLHFNSLIHQATYKLVVESWELLDCNSIYQMNLVELRNIGN